ncbi:Protein FAR-RED IMPAIRED RESPONSE 1 [Bienertia sinuspersici]
MHNVVRKERSKEFDETDCRAMFEYFAKMKEANEDFFFSWRVDEANKLMDVVWVNARSRVAYMDFCDVVCFDATYITNHYELPFANFVGVNHHGQTILLGCALVRNEDTETYKWVMREWLECMGGVQPGGIITDQSVPMAKAIEQVLPDSKHRLCVWHILSKVPRKLQAVKKVGEVHKKMKDVVVLSAGGLSSFESFNLEGNEWLNSLWEERSRWVPTYVKDTFWAGMSTTQRVESIHHFFKGFMNAKTSFREFVQKYTRAIECRANAEKVVTANDDRGRRGSNQPLWSRDAKFKEVQTECLALMYVLPGTEVQLSETVTEYTLVERIQVGDPIRHVTRGVKVTVDMEKLEFTCTCRMFEHKGILCRHFPDKYVLNRWRKDVKRKHLDVKVAFHGPDKTENELRYGRLQHEYEKIFNLASTSNELCEHAVKNAETFFEELEQLRLRTGSENGQDDFIKTNWKSPSKTPYGFPQQKKSKGSTRSKGSTEGSVTKPAPQYQVPLQFDVHRPPRPDFRWAINEQQHSQVHPQLNGGTEHAAGCYSNSIHLVMTTEDFRGLRRQFRLLRVVCFVHYIQGPSLTGGPLALEALQQLARHLILLLPCLSLDQDLLPCMVRPRHLMDNPHSSHNRFREL